MARLAVRLPLIALALAALVAAIMLAPRPAEAAHEVWSGTLTAKQLAGNSYGCNNSESNSANRCSSALTSDSLTIGGQAYRIHTIAAKGGGDSPSLKLRLALPSDARYSSNSPRNLTLKIGTNSWIIPNAGTLNNPNPAITFTANQQVAMSIEDTYAPHTTAVGSFDWAAAQKVWSATLTTREIASGTEYGCAGTGSLTRCASNLTSHTFRIGRTTYRVTSATTVAGELSIRTTPALPESAGGWGLVVYGPDVTVTQRQGVDYERINTRTYTIPSIAVAGGTITLLGNVPVFQAGQSVDFTLYRTFAAVVAEDREKPASRSGSFCGGSAPTGANDAESAEDASLWHCHGDSVYHRHEQWRAPHQPRPERAPTLAPQRSSQAEQDKGFAPAGWHSHGSGDTYIYHNHRGGHPHCTGDGC